MKKLLISFLKYFLLIVIINIIFSLIIKAEVDIVTTLSVSFGVSAGFVFVGDFISRKLEKE